MVIEGNSVCIVLFMFRRLSEAVPSDRQNMKEWREKGTEKMEADFCFRALSVRRFRRSQHNENNKGKTQS